MKLTGLLTGILLLSLGRVSGAAPTAAECLATDAAQAVASVEYNGKTYRFRDPACKEEFLSDPERFSQLYDALLELKSQGQPLPKPPDSDYSAVPA